MRELVERRTRNSKTFQDEVNPRKFALDATIGAIHYKDNPQDEAEEWKDIDNTLEPAPAPWDYQMLKAGYHIRVLTDFIAGQVIEFEKQGEYVRFQPMALQYSNDLTQIQQISMPQSGASVAVEDNTIKWVGAYGEGLDFSWQCTRTRLVKLLTIDRLDRLPPPEQYILDGGNPVLELNLIFAPSRDLDCYIDKEVWDKRDKKETISIVEWKKDGETLFGFMPLRYWDSGEPSKEGLPPATMQLKKSGNSLYISIRVPYSWVQNAQFPIYIDTIVDEQVAVSDDDAHEYGDGTFITTGTLRIYALTYPSSASYRCTGARFQTVDVPQGATITTAYQELYLYSETYDDLNCKIYGNDVDDAVDFVTDADIINRVRTTAYASWVADALGIGWKGSNIEIKTVIQEIVNRASWVANNDLVLLYIANTDMNKFAIPYSQDDGYGPKLHIEYEAAAGFAYSQGIIIG